MGKVRWGWILGDLNSERKIMCNEDIQHLKGTVKILLERWFVKALVDASRSWTQSAARATPDGSKGQICISYAPGSSIEVNWRDWALSGGRQTGKYAVEVRAETLVFCVCFKKAPWMPL